MKAIAVAWLLALSSVAHAGLVVAVDPCVAISRLEFERLLALELGIAPPPSARLQLSCDESGVAITFSPQSRPGLVRRLSAPVGLSARARLYALASAELIAQSREQTAESVTVKQPPASFFSHRFALAGFASMTYFAGTGPLFGGGIHTQVDLSHHIEIALDARAEHGDRGGSLGNMAIDSLTATANLLGHYEWSRFRLRFGGGLRAGAVHLEGQSSAGVQGNAAWAPWAGPELTLAGQLVLYRRLHLGLSLEVGYAAVAVRGDSNGTPAAAIEGAWVTTLLSLGVYL